MEKLRIGELLVADRYLYRNKHTEVVDGIHEWEEKMFPKAIPVYFIGYRTLTNGKSEWVGLEMEDQMNIYIPSESIRVLLVVKNTYTKPFYIPIP